MTRTAQLLALAEAALEREPLDVNEDLAIYGNTSWSRVQRSFIAAANPETIRQLVELLRLQNAALIELSPCMHGECKQFQNEAQDCAIEAFNKWENGNV